MGVPLNDIFTAEFFLVLSISSNGSNISQGMFVVIIKVLCFVVKTKIFLRNMENINDRCYHRYRGSKILIVVYDIMMLLIKEQFRLTLFWIYKYSWTWILLNCKFVNEITWGPWIFISDADNLSTVCFTTFDNTNHNSK